MRPSAITLLLLSLLGLTGCDVESAPAPASVSAPSTSSPAPTPTIPAALPEIPAAAAPTSSSPTLPAKPPVAKSPAAKTSTARKPVNKPKLTCEPNADARVVNGVIVNKNCPKINAAKEKAQREYLEQQRGSESDAALQACREQTGQTTAQCREQAARGEAS